MRARVRAALGKGCRARINSAANSARAAMRVRSGSPVMRRLGKIEAMIEGLERRLWMTVYGVVAVILTQAVQGILQYAPK